MRRRLLPLILTAVIALIGAVGLVPAMHAVGVMADEDNRIFLHATAGGASNAATWTPTAASPATPTPTQAIVQLPDDLINGSNPDFASLPPCQDGATPGRTIP